MHAGHRYLLTELKSQAHAQGLGACAVTFSQHPREVITGAQVPLLTSRQERIRLIKSMVDKVVELDFKEVRHLTAEQFMRLLHDRFDISLLLMGYDHHFGSDRLASPDDYAAAGGRAGVQVRVMEQAPQGSMSSSKIREALDSGEVERAAQMLGRAYAVEGRIVHGRGIGHQIGFPTANLAPDEPLQLLPKKGVYAGEMVVGEHRWRAVINVGTNPTITASQSGNDSLSIEAHLLDYKADDLYGRSVTLLFVRRLRDEQRFDSLDDLRSQIAQDIENIS